MYQEEDEEIPNRKVHRALRYERGSRDAASIAYRWTDECNRHIDYSCMLEGKAWIIISQGILAEVTTITSERMRCLAFGSYVIKCIKRNEIWKLEAWRDSLKRIREPEAAATASEVKSMREQLTMRLKNMALMRLKRESTPHIPQNHTISHSNATDFPLEYNAKEGNAPESSEQQQDQLPWEKPIGGQYGLTDCPF